ncbi:MAG: hypothetical protein AB7T49_00250 [Oligoflexales bacterium]
MTKFDQYGKFLGIEKFCKDHFFKGRSEAESLLMIYSCIEVALKAAATSVIADTVEVITPMQQAVVEHLIDGIESDSRGHRSRLLKVIARTVFKDSKGKFDASALEEMKMLRDRIAHAACRHMDKSLAEIESSTSVTIEAAWAVLLPIVEAANAFGCLHAEQKSQHFKDLADEMIAEAEASERNAFED